VKKANTPRSESKSWVSCALRDDQRVVSRKGLVFALRDTTPVTLLHTPVLTYRHAPTYFDLSNSEFATANDLLRIRRSEILRGDPTVAGFNVGANVGAVSGQTVFHYHIHLIPRRKGD